jgi:hypothetical protein
VYVAHSLFHKVANTYLTSPLIVASVTDRPHHTPTHEAIDAPDLKMVEGHLSYYGYMTDENAGLPPEEKKKKKDKPRFLQKKRKQGCRTCF